MGQFHCSTFVCVHIPTTKMLATRTKRYSWGLASQHWLPAKHLCLRNGPSSYFLKPSILPGRFTARDSFSFFVNQALDDSLLHRRRGPGVLGQRSVYTVITWVNRAWTRLPTPPILNTNSTVPSPRGLALRGSALRRGLGRATRLVRLFPPPATPPGPPLPGPAPARSLRVRPRPGGVARGASLPSFLRKPFPQPAHLLPDFCAPQPGRGSGKRDPAPHAGWGRGARSLGKPRVWSKPGHSEGGSGWVWVSYWRGPAQGKRWGGAQDGGAPQREQTQSCSRASRGPVGHTWESRGLGNEEEEVNR